MSFHLSRLTLAFAVASLVSHAATLTDNLAKTNSDIEFIGGATWIAGAFKTDNSAYQISTATLLMSTPDAGTPRLDLYSAAAGQPGSLLSTLTSPGSVSSSLSQATFTGSSYILSANTNYWLVLKAITGTFDWGWTNDNTGAGPGFLPNWGATDDAGATWFVATTLPMQFRVLADPAPAIPEPASILLAALGLFAIGYLARLRTAVQSSYGSSPYASDNNYR